MSLKEFWQSLNTEQQEQLRPYLEAERGAMIKELTNERRYKLMVRKDQYKKRRRILV